MTNSNLSSVGDSATAANLSSVPECKIQPLFAKVILQREKLNTTIIIPTDVERRNAPTKGIVLAVGPDAEGVKPGDKVYFGQHAGGWIDIEGEEYFICIDEDIHGIVK